MKASFINALNRIHAENIRHPRHRSTRTCLHQDVHPNQEAFVTSDGNYEQEGEFWPCFSRLKQEEMSRVDRSSSDSRRRLDLDHSLRQRNPKPLRATVSAPLFRRTSPLVPPTSECPWAILSLGSPVVCFAGRTQRDRFNRLRTWVHVFRSDVVEHRNPPF